MRYGMVLACALLASPAWAQEAGFKVVGTVANGPVVGAAQGETVYGVTPGGGAGSGTLFSLRAGKAAVLHAFDGSTDGSTPTGPLAIDKSGAVSGTASHGGQYNDGTLWTYSATAGFGVLHAFGASGDGAYPLEGPVRDAAGHLFGSTAGGAVATNGNVFRWSPGGAYASLHDFLSGSDGHCPFSGVAHGKSGVLYGTTVGNGYGGNPGGSVWMLKGHTLTTLHVFQDGADGEYPDVSPALDQAGQLYGTTSVQNGAAFDGALWRIDVSGHFSVLHSFLAAVDGARPNGPLLLGKDGDLYGTTATGGAGGAGTLYRITPQGAFSVVHAFAGGADGGNPTGPLARNAAGAIFGGMASGQVFRLQP